MNNLDLLGRIKRTYLCQMRRFYFRIWKRCKPEIFRDHPALASYLWYASQKGVFPRLKHPRDFNELLISLNLQSIKDPTTRDLRIKCTDKYAVRHFVSDKGFNSILNKCYGVYDCFNEIDFSRFPNEFVLKLTSGCGQNYICQDKSKIDYHALSSMFSNWIENSSSFGLTTGEWHYSHIKPRIIAEKYLTTLGEKTSIIDYKFHCIKGKVVGILVCYDRDPITHQANFDFYDTNWQLTDGIYPQFHKKQRVIPRPLSFDMMINISERISSGIDYVRVDLYEINGLPVFGEMTFTPAGNVMTKYRQWVMDKMLKVYYGLEKSI